MYTLNVASPTLSQAPAASLLFRFFQSRYPQTLAVFIFNECKYNK